MPLDLQPVAEELDLQPVGSLDLQPVSPDATERDAMRISLAAPDRTRTNVIAGMTEPPERTSITGIPIIDALRFENPSPENYGSGLLPEMSYAVNQTAKGFLDFFNSAEGAAVAATGPLGLGTLTAAGFALWGLKNAPEQFQRAIELAKEGKTAESRAAFLELTASAEMVIGGAGHVGQALTPKPKPLSAAAEAQVLKGMSPAAPFEDIPKNEIRLEVIEQARDAGATKTADELAKINEELKPAVTVEPAQVSITPLTDQALKATEPTVQESLTVEPVVKESVTAEPVVANPATSEVAPVPAPEPKPINAYHFTTESFTDFDPAKIGQNTGHSEPVSGFYLTQNPKYEGHIAEGSRDKFKRMDVQVGLKNPLRVRTFDELDKFGNDGLERRRNIESAGYDGVIAANGDEIIAFRADQLKPKPAAPQKQVAGKRPYLAPRRDGQPDILDAIQEVGGIRTPGNRENTGGEYDGYAESTQGAAAILRRSRGGLSPDLLMQALDEHGYHFETPDQMWDAINRASAGREALKTPTEAELTDKFQQAALSNQGRSATEGGMFRLNSKDLAEGDRIKIKGEWFDVTGREGDNVFVNGERSGHQQLPDNTEIHLDRGGLLKKGSIGAAALGELPIPPDIPPEGQVPDTSIKNASLDQARIDLSLEPIEKVARKGWEQIWDEAGAAMEQNPSLGELKTNDYHVNPRAFENEVDQAIVFRHEIAVRTTYTSVLMDLNEAIVKGDVVRADELRRSRDLLEQKLDVVDTVAKAGGSALGGTLNARKMMIREDMSLGAITRREQIAADRPLTDAEHAQIAELHAQLEAKHAEFEAHQEKAAAAEKTAVEKAVMEALKEQSDKATTATPYVIGIAERLVKKWNVEAEEARAFLRGKAFDVTSTLDPKFVEALIKVGRANLAEIGLDFAKWSLKMKADIGEHVAPYLEKLFEKSQTAAETDYIKSGKSDGAKVKRIIEKADTTEQRAAITEQIQAKVDKGGTPDLGLLAHKLALTFVRDGVTEWGPLIDAVHQILKEVLPEMTRAQAEDAVSGYGKSTPVTSDPAKFKLSQLKGEGQAHGKLRSMAGGEAPLATGKKRVPPSDEKRALDKKVSEAKRKGGYTSRTPEEELKSAQQAIETRLQNEITDLDTAIRTNQRLFKQTTKLEYGEKAKALKAERDAKKAEYDAAFPEEPLTPEEAHANALKAAQKNQAVWEEKLSDARNGIFQEKVTADAPKSEQIQRIKANVDAIKEEVKALKDAANPKPTKSAFQRAIDAYKKRKQSSIKSKAEQIFEGRFDPRPKRPALDISKDKDAMRLLAEEEKIKETLRQRIAAHEAENFNLAQKTGANLTATIALSRNVMTGYDVSAVGRQGGFIGAGNPLRAARNIGPMLKAMMKEDTARAIEQSILHRPNANLYKRDKLFLAPLEEGKITAGEEATIGAIKLVQKIPGLRASNRAYITYLNLLRADSYDAMMLKQEGRAGTMTAEDGQDIANFVNVATGRGDLGRLEGLAGPAASVLFSPRLNVSRVQMAVGQPIWKANASTRRLIAEEYAKTALGVGAFIGLAVLAGATIETDPRSSDFAKLKFWNTRIDVLMGMQQYGVALARTISGETKSLKTGKLREVAPGDVLGQMVRTKTTPALGAGMDALDIAHGKNPPPGHGQTYLQVASGLWLPITSRNVVDIMEEHGAAAGSAFELLDLLGISVQHFDVTKPAKPPAK